LLAFSIRGSPALELKKVSISRIPVSSRFATIASIASVYVSLLSAGFCCPPPPPWPPPPPPGNPRRRNCPCASSTPTPITPAATASFTDGLLTVTDDALGTQLVLVADLTGAIRLQQDGGAPAPIPGGPTLGNTNAIIMQGNGGNDALDVSQVPGTNRTVILDGGAGNDTLTGGQAADSLVGGAGNDSLLGFQGDDRLIGGADNDVLVGGNAKDTLTGGLGADHFGAKDKASELVDLVAADGDVSDAPAGKPGKK
jgi:hypothetical protein